MKDRILEWRSEIETGNDAVDIQSKKFIHKANEFIREKRIYQEINLDGFLNSLTEYIREHFEAQQELMKHIGYPSIKEHTDEHLKFSRQVAMIYKKLIVFKSPDNELEKTEMSISGLDGIIDELCDVTVNWYDFHMLVTDKRLADYYKMEYQNKSHQNNK